mgnify:FL=1
MGSIIIESAGLLGDVCVSFSKKCLEGIKANKKRIEELVNNSLMLVTALNTKIGYYKAAEIANKAHMEGTSLKEASMSLGYLTENEFDKLVRPELMTGNDL